MKYRQVIFDFDGTLADSFPWVVSVMDELADHYKYQRAGPSQVSAIRGMSPRQLMDLYRVPFWKIPGMARDMRNWMARDISQIPMFAGISQVLQQLSDSGVRLAVVTSNAYENVCKVLGPENAAMIEDFECGVSLFGKTPHLKNVLKKSRISAADTLCIGDEIRDIQAAHKLKMPFGAVSWGYAHLEALQGYSPEETFHTPEDILSAVLSHDGGAS